MNKARIIYHLARADFYERVRRYSFLVMLGLSVFLGYQVATGNLHIRLDTYRGEFNSAWVGSTMALMITFFFGWFGFYLVKGSVMRDRETGVGQIMATTPISRPLYTIGKWLSNMTVFVAMLVVLAVTTIAIQLLAGEHTDIDLIALYAPFLFVALPMLALVAATAVLFETIGFLQSGLGNLIYFFLFIFTIPITLSFTNPALEPTGIGLIEKSMTEAARAQIPEYQEGFTLGASSSDVTGIFQWSGMDWTPSLIVTRFGLVGVAVLITFLAAIFFDRFDPSKHKPAKFRKKSSRPVRAPEPITKQSITPITHLSPINAGENQYQFLNLLRAEMKLLLKGQKWWWYVGAGGLIIASVFNTAAVTREVVLPITWVWPVLIWSSLGNRDLTHNTHQFTFSCPSPNRRQIPAQWVAGFLVALVMASGAIFRFGIEGQLAAVWALLAGAVFIPSLAMVSGVWSQGSKLFEILYILLWYIGPINRVPELDFIGATAVNRPEVFMLLSVAFLALTIAGRTRQLQR